MECEEYRLGKAVRRNAVFKCGGKYRYLLKEYKGVRMKKNKVITLITIIAVIAIAAVFLGVNYLMDAYARYQREEQLAAASGNQAAGGQQFPAYVQNLIRNTMEAPEEHGICGENLEWYYKDEVLVITGTGKMDEYI